MQLLAIDLAKQVFHVHGVGPSGIVVSKRVRRRGSTAVPRLCLSPTARCPAGITVAAAQPLDLIDADPEVGVVRPADWSNCGDEGFTIQLRS